MKKFKWYKYIAVYLFSVLVFVLAGCHSDGEFEGGGEVVTLSSIQIAPGPQMVRGSSELVLPVGIEQTFSAVGTYSDGTSKDITDSVFWSSSDTDAATITSGGVLTSVAKGILNVTAEQNGITSNSIVVGVTNPSIVSIQATPVNITLAKGQTRQLEAIATYDNNTTADVTDHVIWQAEDESTALLTSSGKVTGIAVGETNIMASQDGVSSNLETVNVTSAFITDIQITPELVTIAKGDKQQLKAVAIYNDGTTSDMTDSAVWHSSDMSIASVSARGILIGEGEGSTDITAGAKSKDGLHSNVVAVDVKGAYITSINISPENVTLAKGQSQQLTATALYSDGGESDVSKSASWISTDTNKVIVSSTGLVTGESEGKAIVTAMGDNLISYPVEVQATNAVVTDIKVTPAPFSTYIGAPKQLMATATYSDGSNKELSSSVSWISGDLNIATVDLNGVLTGEAEGSTTITAHLDDISSDVVDVDFSGFVDVCGHVPGYEYDKTPQGGIDNSDLIDGYDECLKIREIHSDINDNVQWLTSSPGFIITGKLGYSLMDSADNTGDTFAQMKEQHPLFRQDGKDFVSDGESGQYGRWCQKLSAMNFAGRTNWQRALSVKELYEYENAGGLGMDVRFGWPVVFEYHSTIFNDIDGYIRVDLVDGSEVTSSSRERSVREYGLATCASVID